MTLFRWLSCAGALALAAGCAQSNGDINRVQPNQVRKSDLLDGQWYVRNTVTWAPSTTGFTFAGETGKLEKIVFEVQEGYLVGYRSYPYIPGMQEGIDPSSVPSGTTTRVCVKGRCSGGQKFYGAPVVMYSIDSHFDVQRNYNATTKEQGNVIEENSSDRPWNEREYIRVNWSENIVHNEQKFMQWNTIQNPAGQASVESWIQPNDPDADPYDYPTFEEKGGKLSYFDYTGRYYAEPDSIEFEGTKYPFCILSGPYQGYRYDCSGQEIRMRTSFAKVDTQKTLDYEPLVYGNDLMNKFGYFRTERLNYDRKFGFTDSNIIYLANRHNIWKQSFQRDANGNVDQRSPIPFANREIKPIVYYTLPANRMGGAANYQEYLEAARILEAGWDTAFRRAAAAAQQKSPGDVAKVFHVCENPVPEGAPEACGAVGFAPKFGDLRYNFLATHVDATPNGLLGYGPSGADPETGEIISANANTYAAAVEYYGQYVLDVVDLITGEKKIDEFISGQDVREYVMMNPAYASLTSPRQGFVPSELAGAPTSFDPRGAFDKAIGNMAPSVQRIRSVGLNRTDGNRLRAAMDILAKQPQLESLFVDTPDIPDADVFAMLPAPLARAAAVDPAKRYEARRQVLLNLPAARELEKARIEFASRNNMYLAEFMDAPMRAYAVREAQRRRERLTQLQSQGVALDEARRIANEEIRRRARQNVWRATSEHEVGHTLGLRHNFQGSYDAMNFFPKYWETRRKSLTVTLGNGQKILPRTPEDLKRSLDGLPEQIDEGIHDHQYSSIMDYGGKINADFQGVGKYDEAAVIFAYSGGREPGYVEVFKGARRNALPSTILQNGGASFTDIPAGATALAKVGALRRTPAVPNYTERYHYSLLPVHLGEGSNLDQVITDGLRKLGDRRLVKWSDVKVHQDRIAKVFEENPSAGLTDLGEVPLEVPYMFCTDDHVGYVLSCNRFDRGADYYEMNRGLSEDYWNNYFFSHFRRDRLAFSSGTAMRGAEATFVESARIYQHWVYAISNRQGATQQSLAKVDYDPLIQDTWAMAVLDGINNMLSVMSTPDPGVYVRGKFGDGTTRWESIASDYYFTNYDFATMQRFAQSHQASVRRSDPAYTVETVAFMPRGMARRMYGRWDINSGFGWQNRMMEVGHYNDQFGALFAAINYQATFLGVDDIADEQRYAIPYYLVFKDKLDEIFGALWTEDEAKLRPTVYQAQAGDATKPARLAVAYRPNITGSDLIGTGFGYPKTTPVTSQPLASDGEVRLTWNTRIFSLLLGMAGFSVNYDLDYAKQNQVIRVGGDENVTPPPDHEPVELQDSKDFVIPADEEGEVPNVVHSATGFKYAAIRSRSATVDTPAVKMVRRGIEVKTSIENLLRQWPAANAQQRATIEDQISNLNFEYEDVIRDLDIMRGLYGAFGRPF